MIVIGIDQSYERTGISMSENGKIKKIGSITFPPEATKTDKRRIVAKRVRKYLEVAIERTGDPAQVIIMVERIRTITSSDSIRPTYLKSTAAMIAYIVDAAYDFGVKVYSVDTRCWKARVVGTSKPSSTILDGMKDPKKVETILYLIRQGFGDAITLKTYNGRGKKYNDDAADSACISLVWFKLHDADRKKLCLLEL